MQTSERSEILSLLQNLQADDFGAVARAVFEYQRAHNPLYRRFLTLLGENTRRDAAASAPEFPFLPIQFFKSHVVQSGIWQPKTIFNSSSTTGQTPSQHFVRDPEFYLHHARRGFAAHYGDPADWCILALLPSYLERSGSSLVAMADDFIQRSTYTESGFFLNDFTALADTIKHCQSMDYPTLLLGVSFALLDFAEQCPGDLRGVHIIETGGMKGRRQEITRTELHATLRQAFSVPHIHSEYGMTELFSQAYTLQGGTVFSPAATMRVVATEINDPFCVVAPGRSGVLNIIDLANVDTCSFIATEDVGRVFKDGTFEVLGRLDAAELRGCNLMVE